MPGRSHVRIPHLGGTLAAYQTSGPLDPSKPTLVMINSFLTNSNLYGAQYANRNLTSATNLLAIELLGHGETRAPSEHWTYWDSAVMNVQVLEALRKRGELDPEGKVFVLGTSQGGWVTARMALLAPELVKGIVPLGTSMDYESEESRGLGCWDAQGSLTGMIDFLTTEDSVADFEFPQENADFLIDLGFGKGISQQDREFWREEIKLSYSGDEGRRRARMAAINLRDRDGLHGRLYDVRCPVLWLHGTADAVYSVKNAQREIKKFVNSPQAELRVVEGGEHFLSFSHPKEVDGALVEFVRRWS